MLPVIDETLRRAELTLGELDAVAVANTPGLAGSLLVGLTAAKTLAMAADLPLVAIDHLQAHIYACRIAAREEVFPCVGLIVSGGHSSLYRCSGPIDFHLLGATIDDAAGEAFDKVASMLGLPYPGGPAIQKAARGGDPRAFDFPRSFLGDPDRLDFSFSGLKTAVRYQLVGPGKMDFRDVRLTDREVADLAASFQEAVVDSLVGKAFNALAATGMTTLCVGGGVGANARLREKLQARAEQEEIRLVIAPLELCTDNAVMGAIAHERYRAGLFESLELDVFPGVIRHGP
jgi:N6-L-threonylcarbamoyladenine synthase